LDNVSVSFGDVYRVQELQGNSETGNFQCVAQILNIIKNNLLMDDITLFYPIKVLHISGP
jgi:hypothetical protein